MNKYKKILVQFYYNFYLKEEKKRMDLFLLIHFDKSL